MGSGLGKLTTEQDECVVSLKGTPAKSFQAVFDPRSPSEEINRTPIRILDEDETTIKPHVAAFDPRSPSLGVERTPILLEDRPLDLRPNLDDSLVLSKPSVITLSPPTPPTVHKSLETPEFCTDISPIPPLNLTAAETSSSSPPKAEVNVSNEPVQSNEVPTTPIAPNEASVAESLVQTPVLPISTLNSNVKRPTTENAKRNLRTIVLDKENATLVSKQMKNATPLQKRTPLGHVSANSPALIRPRTIR